jgi:N-acyl-D-amino-acid deacylase
MEGVEDIPEPVLTEGLPWDWTSFPDYLDSLERRAYDIDIAAQFAHAPLRVFVMGQRAADREAATSQDVTEMARIAKEAINAGAFGFTTSRSINHRASDGSFTPTLSASEIELTAIAEAVAQTGKGVLQMILDFEDMDGDFRLVRKIAELSRRPLSMTLVQLPHAPTRWRDLLTRIEQANQDGLSIKGQVCGRPVGLMLGFHVTFCPFAFCPTYQSIAHLPLAEKVSLLRQPRTRERILAEFAVPLESRTAEISRAFASRTVDSASMARLLTDFTRMYALGDPPDYEPPPNSSIGAIAESSGQPPARAAYDTLMQRDGQALIYSPAANFADRNLDSVRVMLTSKHTILGLSDGGAHCGLICDASFTTYMMTHWGRDRNNGLPLQQVVQKLTLAGAQAAGFSDRGVIAPGFRADINVIDFKRLKLRAPRVSYDLPGGGKRLTQEAEGYVRTMVNGVTTYREGEATGALPGRLLRSNSHSRTELFATAKSE